MVSKGRLGDATSKAPSLSSCDNEQRSPRPCTPCDGTGTASRRSRFTEILQLLIDEHEKCLEQCTAEAAIERRVRSRVWPRSGGGADLVAQDNPHMDECRLEHRFSSAAEDKSKFPHTGVQPYFLPVVSLQEVAHEAEDTFHDAHDTHRSLLLSGETPGFGDRSHRLHTSPPQVNTQRSQSSAAQVFRPPCICGEVSGFGLCGDDDDISDICKDIPVSDGSPASSSPASPRPNSMILKWSSVTQGLIQLAAQNSDDASSDASEHQNSQALRRRSTLGQEVHENKLSCLVSHPQSVKRLVWDMVSVLLITYEMTIFPFSAFEPGESDFLSTMGWVTAFFWLFDMPSQFFVGFYSNGILEMRLSKSASAYMKRWFILDLIIVATDWTFILLQSASDVSSIMRMGKTLRVIRILKALRMARIGKFADLFQKLLDRSGISESGMIAMRILKLLIVVIFMNHFVACLWYLLGNSDVSDENWVSHYKVAQESLLYRYTISLHWSLSQLTPGANEVQAKNEYERLFALLMLILGMVGFSSFISKITSQMTQLAAHNAKLSTQDYNLRKFLYDHQVTSKLSSQIWNYLRANERTLRGHVPEKDALLLKEIPESFMIELHVEVYAPCILQHPLFEALADTGGQTFYKICHTALSTRALLSRHLLFMKDERACSMSFVVFGCFEYTRRRPHGVFSNDDAVPVAVGEWVCEPLLWFPDWVHAGFLIAAAASEVYQLNVATFKKLTAKGKPGSGSVAKYGAAFVKRSMMASPPRDSLGDVDAQAHEHLPLSQRPSTASREVSRDSGFGESRSNVRDICDDVGGLREIVAASFPVFNAGGDSVAHTAVSSLKHRLMGGRPRPSGSGLRSLLHAQ